MDNHLMFDYYYGMDAEQFSFLRVPKILLKDPTFKPLSAEAKILYSLMLDRLSLSQKNGWLDEQNRVYIIYSTEEIREEFNCSQHTCVKIIQELEEIGLIEKKRRGLGKANLIYVKNFISVFEQKSNEKGAKIKSFAEVQKMHFKKCKNCDSGSAENALQEVQKMHRSNTYIKETYNSNTDSINQSIPDEEVPAPSNRIDGIDSSVSETEDKEQNKDQSVSNDNQEQETAKPQTSDSADTVQVPNGVDPTTYYRQLLKDQLHYEDNTNPEYYKDTHSDYPQFFSELFEVVCDVVCVPRKTIRVGGKPYPYEMVRSRFLKLTESDLAYVVESVKAQTCKIRNMRAYLITSLYYSHESAGLHLAQRVQHDLYGKAPEPSEVPVSSGELSEMEKVVFGAKDADASDLERMTADRAGTFDTVKGKKVKW
jgi:DNA-binding Lrp family transcriptional regulator